MRTSSSPAVQRLGALVYCAAIVAAAGVALRGHLGTVGDELASVPVTSALGALLTSCCALALGMLSFRALIASLGAPLGVRQAAEVYFVGQAGKYLPGSIWPAMVQARLGRRYGVPQRTSYVIFFVGLVHSLVVGTLVGTVALSLVDPRRWLAPALAALLGTGLVVVGFVNWPVFRARLPAVLRRRLPEQAPLSRPVLVATVQQAGTWVLHGLQVAILARAIGIDIADLTVLSIGAFALAFVGGTLFLIAPAGAGVREAILVSLLGGADWKTFASVVILSRIVLLVADLGLAALGFLLARTNQRVPEMLGQQEEGVEGAVPPHGQ